VNKVSEAEVELVPRPPILAALKDYQSRQHVAPSAFEALPRFNLPRAQRARVLSVHGFSACTGSQRARVLSVHAQHHHGHHKHEVIEPLTIAIITGFCGGVVSRCLRSICTI
jgi:hypothetical protein